MVHEADLRALELAVRPARQFRLRDHLPDADRPPAALPDRTEAVQVDGGDARRPAEDEGPPGQVEGRQAAAAAGDAEALSGGEGEPDGGLRSEERRVGKGCVRTSGDRWSQNK